MGVRDEGEGKAWKQLETEAQCASRKATDKEVGDFMEKMKSNFAFEADAVKRRAVSCCVRAPRGSTRR